MEAYKEWLLCGDDRTSAKCKVCPIPQNKTELSNLGEKAIKSNARGKKHCNRLVLYIQNSCIKFMPAESPNASSTPTCSSALNKFVVLEAAAYSEIRKCLKNMSSYSFRPCDGLADMFRRQETYSIGTFCLGKEKFAYFHLLWHCSTFLFYSYEQCKGL